MIVKFPVVKALRLEVGSSIELKFVPQDIWVGVYWKRDVFYEDAAWDVYVCLVPMLPIHFSWVHCNSQRIIQALDYPVVNGIRNLPRGFFIS